mmetsp:Transcript_66389/g.192377  ORF Transcript_66389/g.192377 Transcript_66389/m.192377 type:complete len:487 (+) Transcript_66389:3-1463(+)
MHGLGLDILAEHHASGELDKVDIQGLRDEGHGPRGTEVALDDLHGAHGLGGALEGEELHVEGARDLQRPAEHRRDVHHLPVCLHWQLLRGQEERGVAAVRAGVLHVLGDGVVDEAALAPHGVELDLAGTGDVLGDDHGVLLLDDGGGAQEALQLGLVVDDAHRRAGEHVGGPDKDREAHLLRECKGLLEAHELAPFRLVDAHPVAQRGELRAILGGIDGLRRRAEDVDAMLVELRREVVWRLPADGDDDARGILEVADLEHRLQRQLFEVQAVALVVIRRNRLRVAVDDHGTVAGLTDCPHGADATPVKLHRGADAVATGAKDNEGVFLAGLRHDDGALRGLAAGLPGHRPAVAALRRRLEGQGEGILVLEAALAEGRIVQGVLVGRELLHPQRRDVVGVAHVGQVQVIRLRGELGRQCVDLLDASADVPNASEAHDIPNLAAAAQSVGNLLVAEAELLAAEEELLAVVAVLQAAEPADAAEALLG